MEVVAPLERAGHRARLPCLRRENILLTCVLDIQHSAGEPTLFMSSKDPLFSDQLSKRERQVMDALMAAGQATAAELRGRLGNALSYSAVRAVLRVLEEKGLAGHKYDGPRYVYSPLVSRQQAKKSALKKILETFFEGSREQLVATLLDSKEAKADPDELARLAELIRQAHGKGR